MTSILRIIKESILKVRISLSLLHLVNEQKAIITKNQQHEVEILINLYFRNKIEPSDDGELQLLSFFHKVIEDFYENLNILTILHDGVTYNNEETAKCIYIFDKLYIIMAERLQKSELLKLYSEKRIYQWMHRNDNLKSSINDTDKLLSRLRIVFLWKIAAKKAVIQRYGEMLAREKWQNSLTIRDEINKSNKLFQSIRSKKSEVETELRDSFKETETLYRTQMKNDFNKEFNMHDEKTTLKTQLQNIIRRYDATLSEMTYDVINLDKKYSDIREIYDVFMEKYNSKEKEYLEVLEQMEKEEKTRQEEMLMLFMMNRAARFIQKYWRRYRKDKKKKSKKGKGSKSKRR